MGTKILIYITALLTAGTQNNSQFKTDFSALEITKLNMTQLNYG